MKTMNQVLIEGNLTRNAELRTVRDNIPLCAFSLAYNRSYRAGNEWKRETGYFDVTQWGPAGKEIAPRLVKGTHVLVVGRLRYERWTDKEGRNRSRVTILADQVTVLGGAALSTARPSQPSRPLPGRVQENPGSVPPMTEYPRLRAELAQIMNSGEFDSQTARTVLAEAERIPPKDIAALQALLLAWRSRQRKAS